MTAPGLTVACLTPPGSAAVATLAVAGPDAWTVCRDLFTPRKGELPPTPDTPGRFWLGRLGTDLKDECVLTLKQGGPEPLVEVHCHGGRQVLDLLLGLFGSRGAAVCSWEDWLRRTEPSPLLAEAAVALAGAPTARTAAILLDQYHGAFENALAAVRSADPKAVRVLDELARHGPLGRHLTAPWRVVIAGAPNVGKSSLVNALAGFQRSVVSETPGTTRDVVGTRLAIDGWPVELIDTAGLRPDSEGIEEEGIRRAALAARSADLCLWVVDASAAPAWPDQPGALLVVNKTDLPPAWDLASVPEALRLSAKTGAGLPELCDALSRRLVPQPPAHGAAVPFTPEWCDRVEQAHQHAVAGDLAAARALLG